jgi:hypothetical protein
MPADTPKPYYVAAGDPGLKTVRPLDPTGGTEWLCRSAVLTSVKYEADLSDWVRSILSKAGAGKSSDLHYRNLLSDKRRIVANEVAQLPIRL